MSPSPETDSESETRTVLVERHDQCAILTLNRPHRLNAVNESLYVGLITELRRAEADPEARAIVVRGTGRAFCVGADLKAHSSARRTPEQQKHYVDLGQKVCEVIQTNKTPVIAAVHGYALGAGAEMAVSADFLVVAEEAQLGFPEVSIGTFVGGGVTHRLPRLIGLRRATDLLILGERFTGRQAQDWGLASRAVPEEQVSESALDLAATLATKAPLSFARMKDILRRDLDMDTALRTEPEHLLALMQTEDWAEGVAAFAEKRPPVFRGR